MDPRNFTETALDNIRRDGFTVIKDALAPEVRSAIRLGLDPWLQGTRMGRNDFEGIRSERVYALLAKVPEKLWRSSMHCSQRTIFFRLLSPSIYIQAKPPNVFISTTAETRSLFLNRVPC